MTIVAIDGPSGSGKSSVSKEVAKQLGFAYLDTGAMYRAAAIWVESCGIDLADANATSETGETSETAAKVAEAVAEMPLVEGLDPRNPTVSLGGRDVTQDIRADHVATIVSKVATNLAVRAEMKRRQREIIAAAIASGPGIVAEGRDITTVVAPDADVRILLTADPEARLRRRALENTGKTDEKTVAATKDQVLRRDADDATVSEFRTAAPGVTTVDSSNLNWDQTVAAVLKVIAENTGERTHV
ncbi:MAG: (d)CMP kinase [Cellulomonadaceae bacterium]|jgi:cytidylate kinase|nr:(d)CMP kinase [Cellulomonadaceae bacterium]